MLNSSSTLKLNSNYEMPIIGLGTWKSPKDKAGEAVKYALTEANYKHIDCAFIYHNEQEIGQAFEKVFASKKVKREEVFITSKLWNNKHRAENVEAACRQTLADLKLEYLDLYLMHWGIAFPNGEETEPMNKDGSVQTDNVSIQETWQAMEKLVEKGLVKSIGVANFTTMMLVDLFTYAKIRPAVNQIELHPYNSQQTLVDFCTANQVVVTAYSPLGSPGNASAEKPRLFEDDVIKEIAKSKGKSAAQILIRWAVQRGTIAIPKSTTPERIKENFSIFDFELNTDEMDRLNNLNRNYRFVDPTGWWKIPYFN